jgi:hypothetical protein
MKRTIKLGAVGTVALLATVAVAMAGVKSGDYAGTTQDDGEPITITVGKKPGERGKWVKNVFVEQSAECTEDLEFTKDDKIKNNKFKVRIKGPIPGIDEASVSGEFLTEGVVGGTLKQITCDGNDDDYVAYLP